MHSSFPAVVANLRSVKEFGLEVTSSPTILKAAVKVLPEVTLLTSEDSQDFWVAVEIEGVLHNRRALEDTSIDLVFVVDNG